MTRNCKFTQKPGGSTWILLRTATVQMRTGGLLRLPWQPALREGETRPHKVIASILSSVMEIDESSDVMELMQVEVT